MKEIFDHLISIDQVYIGSPCLLFILQQNKLPGAFFVVFLAFLFSDVVFHARYSAAWQAVGKFIVHTFY